MNKLIPTTAEEWQSMFDSLVEQQSYTTDQATWDALEQDLQALATMEYDFFPLEYFPPEDETVVMVEVDEPYLPPLEEDVNSLDYRKAEPIVGLVQYDQDY